MLKDILPVILAVIGVIIGIVAFVAFCGFAFWMCQEVASVQTGN
jgi:hypothetical protein